ncbi:hypothetical protein FKP32DRAFT_1587757 [Trametes sanguinea]|nr:hypothetical protein FKP32DRAFT_1587757 [Trametes sanguinea]
MDRPSLPHDILCLILSLTDKATLARVMRTCRELYRPAATYMLKGEVDLHTSQRHIDSLSSFLLADPLHRLPLLRHLEVATSAKVPDWASSSTSEAASSLDNLLHRLAAAGYLVDLSLSHPDHFIQLHPQLSSTIESFTSLQRLEIYDAGLLSMDVVANLQSCLATLSLTLHLGYSIYAEDPHEANPIPLLRRFQDTLRDLTLGQLSAHCCQLPDAPCYPNLTTLTLETMELPDIRPYARIFPGVTRLYISECEIDWTDVRDLASHADRPVRKRLELWPKLDKYDGHILDLYSLGIVCPISSLLVGCGAINPSRCWIFAAVLEDAQPKDLYLNAICGLSILLDPEFLSCFSHRSLEHLCSLRLGIIPLRDDKDLDWDTVLDSMVSKIISQLPPLSSFELMLDRLTNSDSVITTGHIFDEDLQRPLTRLERQVAAWDRAAFAERACKASPHGTLKVVEIVTHWDNRSYYHYDRAQCRDVP